MGNANSKDKANPLSADPLNQHHHQLAEECTLVWLDARIDENRADCRNSLNQLRRIANRIRLFRHADHCLAALNELPHERMFVIVSGALSRTIVPQIHDLCHVDSIYILSRIKSIHEMWVKQYTKIRGVFAHILVVCEWLKRAARHSDQSSISMSFVSTHENINQLDPSFMYTQILKEILLEITFEKHFVKDLAAYCRTLYTDNNHELKKINKFERDYARRSPVWWYTYDCCIYSMLNRALRLQEADVIVKMGFFIRDLHSCIGQLHAKQFSKAKKSFMVYRGQSLPTSDFDKLVKTKGGLLSFNAFLSTTRNRDVALAFAHRAIQSNVQYVGIIFHMSIDPSVPTTPFASVAKLSYFKNAEKEILFSMHTIFRIGDVQAIEEGSISLWQVELTLTNDNDEQLSALTDKIRRETQETMQQKLGWPRLGNLLLRLGNFNAAEEVYSALLSLTVDEMEKAYLHHQVGVIRDNQSRHAEAMNFYRTSLQIYTQQLPPTHPLIAMCYRSIAAVHNNLHEYSEALLVHHKALEIEEYILPANHYSLIASYNGLGSILYNMKEYTKALLFYEKSHTIAKRILPANHPMFATCYNNIGTVYRSLEDHCRALWYFEHAAQTGQRSLDAHHPHLQLYNSNVELVKAKVNAE